jgi:exopolyphosphatase/guanosine-5'-triphosphate,3'-diphosphate pyrophosphatase
VRGRSFVDRLVRPTGAAARIDPMRVAVIDIGSNTARLLVSEQGRRSAERIGEAKAYLRLGEEILRNGRVGPEKLAETADEARRFVTIARELGATAIDVFVTAPARQADNADELVTAIVRATDHFVRVLSAEEEGELSYQGALATTSVEREPAAVCDVGGGSTEIVVGDRRRGIFWSRSVEMGSLRLTAATLDDDPPTSAQLAEAKALVADLFSEVRPPDVGTALAVGGSARALARLAGRTLDSDTLERTLDLITSQPAEQLARSTSADASRAATLAGGTIILLEVTRRLGVPLQLAGGGLREGAAARLLAPREAA